MVAVATAVRAAVGLGCLVRWSGGTLRILGLIQRLLLHLCVGWIKEHDK